MRAISNDLKQMLPKCTHLWECKVNEATTLCEHFNESVEINTLNTHYEMINHLLRYDILILEAIFHDILYECKEH